jgi:exopolysaccharide biosynthesis polyprenyl glycosylphosphotransferase
MSFPDNESYSSSDRPDRIFCPDEEAKHFKSKHNAAVKRAIDVVGSVTALVVLSPFLLIIAAAIKVTSPGPFLFKQTRLGHMGKEFTFLKFRSMYVGSDSAIHREYVHNLIDRKVQNSNGIYKIQKDPRVTAIGRFLRKSSLDELPQFINVLRGEMSLVGPRPAIRYEVEHYSPWHLRRLEVKPGITGEWQINGRSRTTFDDMIRMDLNYIHNQSVWLDLKILLKTPSAILRGTGAY